MERAHAALAERLLVLDRAESRKVGFPGWSRPLPDALVPFFSYELNNYGDPGVDPVFPWHTKDLERELVDDLADLFHAPADQRWGCVTSGGAEGLLLGLWLARDRHPQARVYHSTAAHSSVERACALLRMRAVPVPTDPVGEIDYQALRWLAVGEAAAVVVATVGTTLTEAVDDVPRIRAALREAGVGQIYVHADAALAGIPLAFAVDGQPAFGLRGQGADSLSVSGHKFLGASFPCGVLLSRRGPEDPSDVRDWTCGAPDQFGSSRNGHAALLQWYLLRQHGTDGLRELVEQGLADARYAEMRLNDVGWRAWRAHPHARTVVFRTPPRSVLDQWPMPSVKGVSHIVCTPGVTRSRIDQFVDVVATATAQRRESLLCPNR